MGRKRIHPKTFSCESCGKEISNPHGFSRIRFCSRACYGKWSSLRLRGKMPVCGGWNRGLTVSGMSGKKQSDLFIRKLRERNAISNPSKLDSVREKFRIAKLWKVGELSNAWKGGKPNMKRQWKNCVDYRDWRRAVLFRDGNKCIFCGSPERLEADHIHPVFTHPFEIYLIENGRTLCHQCHKKTATYGGRALSYVA